MCGCRDEWDAFFYDREGPSDDRHILRFVPGRGFSEEDKITCPEFTGSYLSYDGESLYLSQGYKHRILKLDANGDIARVIDIGAEVSGHAFVAGMIYVLRGTEQNGESWTIARLDPREAKPEVKDIAVVPFECRSLTFDGDELSREGHAERSEQKRPAILEIGDVLVRLNYVAGVVVNADHSIMQTAQGFP